MLKLRSHALFVLLEGLVDYAGLFPPAALSLEQTLANYREYLGSPYRFLLGRLVLPAARLSELVLEPNDAFQISALVEPGQLPLVETFNRNATRVRVDCLEARHAEDGWPYLMFLEGDVEGRGGRKLRTGGLQQSAFPSLDAVRAFLEDAFAREVPFKFTAGLHHALPGSYPVSYEEGCPVANMHGFLQLFLAAAGLFCKGRWVVPNAPEWLEDGVRWEGIRLSVEDLRAFREKGGKSFGSCSFTEPVEELRALGLI